MSEHGVNSRRLRRGAFVLAEHDNFCAAVTLGILAAAVHHAVVFIVYAARFVRHYGAEKRVDEGEHAVGRAEVYRKFQSTVALLHVGKFFGEEHRLGAAESVDCLLDVADGEHLLRAGEVDYSFLHGVDVLIFVDEHVFIPRVNFLPDRGVGEKFKREMLQVCRVEHVFFALNCGIFAVELQKNV